MTTFKFPVLYVFVRQLDSMNNGKAEAHSGHAASAFSEKAIVRPMELNLIGMTMGGTDTGVLADEVMNNKGPSELALEWRKSTPQGFGTQINLNATYEQMKAAVEVATKLGFQAEMVTDPSYPYMLSKEAAALVPKSKDSIIPETGYPIPRIYKREGVVLFREEETAAYVFGDKNDPLLQAIIGNFELK